MEENKIKVNQVAFIKDKYGMYHKVKVRKIENGIATIRVFENFSMFFHNGQKVSINKLCLQLPQKYIEEEKILEEQMYKAENELIRWKDKK